MTFVQTEKRNGMIHLDGYSRNKTLKGALSDLAREVAKIDEGEGRNISEYIDETAQMVIDGMANEPGYWYIEAEEVHCATRLKNPESTEPEMEYAEGHWYLYIRFVAPEQETEEQKIDSTSIGVEAEDQSGREVADAKATTNEATNGKHPALSTETYKEAARLLKAEAAFRVEDKDGWGKDFVPGSIIYNSRDLGFFFKDAYISEYPFTKVVSI